MCNVLGSGRNPYGWPLRKVVKMERLPRDQKIPYARIAFHLACGHMLVKNSRGVYAKSKTQPCGECQRRQADRVARGMEATL